MQIKQTFIDAIVLSLVSIAGVVFGFLVALVGLYGLISMIGGMY